MKKITTLIIGIFFAFSALAQESINWLSIDKFEKAVNKENKKSFILIDDFNNPDKMNKDAYQKRKKRGLSYLNDKDIVDYINKNFICYRYTPNKESITFNGETYSVKEEGKRYLTHGFISFLTSGDKKRLPSIILRDEKFDLFTYKRDIPDIQELEIMLEAEKRKADYISEKAEKDSNLARRSSKTVENLQKQLDQAKENPDDFSVFPANQQASRFLPILKYFVSGENKEKDLRSYIRNNR